MGLGVTTTLRARPRLPDARAFANGTSKHGWLLTASAAGAAALLAKPTYTSARRLKRHLSQRSSKHRRRWLNPAAADAICGAVGEVAQLVMLYPADTLKVLCQAHGTGVRDVVGCLRARNLGPLRLLGTMYAGCGAAAACSVVIGAAYLVSFYHIQRMLTRAVGTRPRLSAQREVQARTGAEASSCAPGEASGRVAARVDVAAACAASMATSLLEGPMEMFRHRMQAGLMQGRMMANMAAAARGGGLGCLYHGYLAFLAKSLPYDVAELFTYSQLGALGGPAAALPAGCRDMLFGACAGTAAVLTSMPADCVKTQIELAAVAAPGGLLPDLAMFFATARSMVRSGGPGALFRGMGPRLADKVPGTMVYWLAVESCRRVLDPYIQLPVDEEEEFASGRGMHEAASPAPLAA